MNGPSQNVLKIHHFIKNYQRKKININSFILQRFSVHVFKNSVPKNTKKKCIPHINRNILDERINKDKITAYVL